MNGKTRKRTMRERRASPRGVGKSEVSKSAVEAGERHKIEIDSLCARRGRLDGRTAMAAAGALDGGGGDSGSAGGRPPTPSRRVPSRRAPPRVADFNARDGWCRARHSLSSSCHQNQHPPPPPSLHFHASCRTPLSRRLRSVCLPRVPPRNRTRSLPPRPWRRTCARATIHEPSPPPPPRSLLSKARRSLSRSSWPFWRPLM